MQHRKLFIKADWLSEAVWWWILAVGGGLWIVAVIVAMQLIGEAGGCFS